MPLPNQDATGIVTNNGLRTQYGVIIPPGAKVAAFVRSTGIQNDGNDAFLAQNLVTTLAAGLARVRAGFGDFVVCLPGHSETVADATTFSNALVAGTRIIGVGKGSNAPTFTWSAVGGRWVVGVNDVTIAGLRLLVAGTVAAPSNTTNAISVTADDFSLLYCDISGGTGTGTALNTLTLSGTASRFDISGNVFRSPSVGGNSATCILVSGTGSDGRIADNEMMFSASSANGIINVTGAALSLKVLRNYLNNSTPTSVSAITYANVAVTGLCAFNTITVLSTGVVTSGTTGITVGGATNLTGYSQNFVVNDPNKSGILAPAADT